jgi:hypothetical protein
MMALFQIIRKEFTDKSTIGSLYLQDFWLCFTLEDVVRPAGQKIPGETAIPEGDYSLVIDMSQRFKKFMPHILNVPGFSGIRIHKGNTDQDTAGCPLVGMHKRKDFIWECSIAYDYFFERLQQLLDEKEDVFIKITH